MHNCERFGQLQYVRAAETFKSSHRPDGIFTCFALMLAGRRCAHQRRHGELLIVHHHRQYILLCACSRSKFPIASVGKMLTRLLWFSLAQLRTMLRSTTGGTCRRDLKVPIAPMGKCLVDMSISILIFYDGCCLELPVWSTCHLRLKLQKFPWPRWERPC